jgi:hypothetical protein
MSTLAPSGARPLLVKPNGEWPADTMLISAEN